MGRLNEYGLSRTQIPADDLRCTGGLPEEYVLLLHIFNSDNGRLTIKT